MKGLIFSLFSLMMVVLIALFVVQVFSYATRALF